MNWSHHFRTVIRHRATRHVLAWIFIISTFNLLKEATPKGNLQVLGVPYSTLLLLIPAAVIYAHYALLTYVLERRRYLAYVLGLAAVLATGTGLLYAARDYGKLGTVQLEPGGDKPRIVPPDSGTQVGMGVGNKDKPAPWLESGANILFVLFASTVVRYLRRGIVSHIQMQELRALQLETELSLLKAQVNQHFLFNTLNNLYGLSLASPDQMPEALLQLAGLIRYQLDSSRQRTVTVGTEAEYLSNYIGLEKLRLRQNTQVEFTVDLPYPEQPLAPLLLLPLVENCFKHAIGPSGENSISIRLTQTDVGLSLRTHNSIPPHFRPAPSGLGLPNLRARLAQLYPNKRHQFMVQATDTSYTATLQLVL
ncbi:hypothetical protein GCM10023185_26240 [Hymenobacter saemangeumensis]|uniref:Signal transduction histidine kinase internal region domain-containing protein n=1 Tax=Hymenobacter saemangeumensis TaxID=1084522 RepID=A0ABP8IIJ6_9BACT